MSITTAICNSFKREVLQGVHEAGDNYKIALFTSAATLNKSTTGYSGSNEVSGQGYVAGGQDLSGFIAGLSNDTAYLDWDDPAWPSASITARGALIYNASKDNKAVACFDFGGLVSSTNASFTVQIPAPAEATAVVRIG